MQIGFFVQETDEASKVHRQVAKYMIASARKVMPDVPIIQFTDDKSPEIEGIDSIVRIGGDLPMAVRRMTHHANCIGDWLFCDTDVIFQKDVRDVFEEEFDVAFTDRVGTYMEHTAYAKQQPYNLGVSFSRNPAFWSEVNRQLLRFPIKYQEWEGDQIVVCGLTENQNTPFDIVILPGKDYNFTPLKQSEDYSHASIVHMKGRRKQWLLNTKMNAAG